jgi:hypothetical protein
LGVVGEPIAEVNQRAIDVTKTRWVYHGCGEIVGFCHESTAPRSCARALSSRKEPAIRVCNANTNSRQKPRD